MKQFPLTYCRIAAQPNFLLDHKRLGWQGRMIADRAMSMGAAVSWE